MKQPLFFHYQNAIVGIGPSMIPEFGKRPSLMVTRGGVSTKVASFSSVEAAFEFQRALADLVRPITEDA